jgi:hypothetical protein
MIVLLYAKQKKTVNEMDAHKSTMELLRARVEQEETNNLSIMTNVLSGDYPALAIKYGDMFQLLHVKSQSFLAVLESAAPYDPECRGLSLDKKGSRLDIYRQIYDICSSHTHVYIWCIMFLSHCCYSRIR